jgi:hypothetical protein
MTACAAASALAIHCGLVAAASRSLVYYYAPEPPSGRDARCPFYLGAQGRQPRGDGPSLLFNQQQLQLKLHFVFSETSLLLTKVDERLHDRLSRRPPIELLEGVDE